MSRQEWRGLRGNTSAGRNCVSGRNFRLEASIPSRNFGPETEILAWPEISACRCIAPRNRTFRSSGPNGSGGWCCIKQKLDVGMRFLEGQWLDLCDHKHICFSTSLNGASLKLTQFLYVNADNVIKVSQYRYCYWYCKVYPVNIGIVIDIAKF